jgi:hypothetical protein
MVKHHFFHVLQGRDNILLRLDVTALKIHGSEMKYNNKKREVPLTEL